MFPIKYVNQLIHTPVTLTDYIQAAKRSEGNYEPLAQWSAHYRDMHRPQGGRGREDGRILHAAMGLCTEAGELIEAMLKPVNHPLAKTDRIEEIGDLAWYCAILMDALGVGAVPEEPIEIMYATWGLAIEAGAFNDMVKRFLFYGADFNHELARARVAKLWNILRALAHADGYSLEAILDRNISKLVKRYPEKFTQFHALNRDLDAERKALKDDIQDGLVERN